MPAGQEEGAVQTLRVEARTLLGWVDEELERTPSEVDHAPLMSVQVMRAAVRMELALRGRVRVNHPRRPERHNAWYYRRAILLFLLILAAYILFTALFTFLLKMPVYSSFWGFFATQMCAWIMVSLIESFFSRKLSVVDATPTGQGELDLELEWMQHPGILKRDWHFFKPRHQQSREEQAGLFARWLVEGLVAYRDVGKAALEEVWPPLQERLRSLLIDGQPPDPQMVALLLLATLHDLHRYSRLPWKDAIIYHLFVPQERRLAHQRLTLILKPAPEMTAHIDPALYDTLLFIRDQVSNELKSVQRTVVSRR